MNEHNAWNRTPIMVAILTGNVEIAERLIQAIINQGGNVDATGTDFSKHVRHRADTGITALHLAVKHGMLSVVKALLQAGADVNCTNDCKTTPLHLA